MNSLDAIRIRIVRMFSLTTMRIMLYKKLMTARELIKKLEEAGFVNKGGTNHDKMVHPDGRVTVDSQAQRRLPLGTLKAIAEANQNQVIPNRKGGTIPPFRSKDMRYPVIVHKDGGSDYGVTVPDFPGVFSGGETLDEALANVQDAIETFYEGEEVERLPDPSPLERVLASEDAEGGAVVLVDVNFDFLEKKAVPVNITVPLYLRNRIDRAAKARGMTRSAFLVRAAQAYM